jgi:hypothetical protein
MATTLSDFNGTYSLINKRGDNGQFTPECTEKLQVVYNSSENFVLGTFIQSTNYITGIRFKNIGQGPIKENGDKGIYTTTLSQNTLVETYEASSLFKTYFHVKSLTLRNKMLIISSKSSDRDIEMECSYAK